MHTGLAFSWALWLEAIQRFPSVAAVTGCSGPMVLFHGTIHVLVSDMVMPKLDGMALREQILRERPTVKVLLMSGSAERPFDGVAFLPKPFETVQLEQRVQELVELAMCG